MGKLRVFPALALFFGGYISATAEDRTIDGTANNAANPSQGSAGETFPRIGAAVYDDGISTPHEAGLPNARDLSNAASAQSGSQPNSRGLSDFVWQWGQFIDHDMTLSETGSEDFDIAVGAGDPKAPGIPMKRTLFDLSTGDSVANPRQQINSITSYIDASMVYGSDAARATALREGSGGRLATSAGNMLPYNTGGLPNANPTGLTASSLYLAGDIRANEQTGLTAMHTLFVREHNRLAAEIATDNPGWTDEQIYQRARKIVGAQVQSITYNEFLPALMGSAAPSLVSSTYDGTATASLSNEFATSFFRVGHTMVSPSLLKIDDAGDSSSLSLASAFFDPETLQDGEALRAFLRGLSSQTMQEVDMLVVDELRNQLFGPPGAGGLDLAALNIQRGRDHGLLDYNSARVSYGLSAASDFSDITSDNNLEITLAGLYSDVGEVDLWVGALAEDRLPDSSLGELTSAALADQFGRLITGDRLFFTFDPELAVLETELMGTRLSDIILRNTGIENLQSNVFFAVPEPSTGMIILAAVFAATAARRRRWKR